MRIIMQSWPFQKKLTAGSLVTVSLAAVTAAVSVYALRAVVTSNDAVIAVNERKMSDTLQLNAAVDRQAAGFRGYVASPDNRFLEERNVAQQEFRQFFGDLQPLVQTEQGKTLIARIRQSHDALTALQDRGIALRATNGGLPATVRLMKEEILPVRDELQRNMNAIAALEQRILSEATDRSRSNASQASWLVVTLAVLAVLFALGTALFLGRTLTNQIGSAVLHVQNSSAELQASTNQQAAGAKETATALSEVTTTMSELLASSRQITESAQQVAQIAEQTGRAAQSGDQTVTQTQQSIESIRGQVEMIVNHMLDLGKKSQQIGGILDIINELAEQTNILSINAMIEAAGAGEQGKRFAIVGEEIRKLADRVSESGNEIRALIEEVRAAVHTTILATEGGSKAVDAGVRQFTEVTRGFSQIAGMVQTTTQAAREIELSTKQQMTAVEQVNAAISGAAQAARETDTGSAQSLQTASQLAELSRSLSRIIQTQSQG